MSFDDRSDANPYAYHEAQDDLPDEAPLQDQLRLAAIKDVSLRLALAMILPSLLMSWLLLMMSFSLLMRLLFVVSDVESMEIMMQREFLRLVALGLLIWRNSVADYGRRDRGAFSRQTMGRQRRAGLFLRADVDRFGHRFDGLRVDRLCAVPVLRRVHI